jgi:hypothetical protein
MGKMYNASKRPKKPVKKKRAKKTGLNAAEKKQVKKIISNRKEIKYCPVWYAYDDYAAYANYLQPRIYASSVLPNIFDPNNNALTCVGLQTGEYLNTASNEVNSAIPGTMYPLGGFGMARGDNSVTIDGDYAYMQSGCIKLEISAIINELGSQDTDPVSTPLQFRVIQVRAKRDAAGTTPSILNSLLLDLTNSREGLNMKGSTKEIMKDFIVNHNVFSKVKDISFKLTQPVKPSTQIGTASSAADLLSNVSCAQTPAYPNSKDLTLWLNKPTKKLRFKSTDDGAINAFEPVNHDFVDYVIILCSRNTFYNSYQGIASNPSQSTQKSWTVAVTGQTKFKDC